MGSNHCFKEEIELVFKYAAQGSSHGHYDKLSYSLYDNGNEVLQDYGLARFVNIEQKGGGNYLAENIIEFGLQDNSNEANDYINTYYFPYNFPIAPVLNTNPFFPWLNLLA